mgnify:CR=1 FL=1
METALKTIAVYILNLLIAAFIVAILAILKFDLNNVSPQLLAGIFTLIVSSAAVLFTSITDNEELMIAAENTGNLTYLFSAFTIPISVSLIGLIVSILGFSFRPPNWLMSFKEYFAWILIIISLWAAIGFLSAVLIVIALEYGIAKERANNQE